MEVQIQIIPPGNLHELEELIDLFEDVFEMKDFVKPDTTHLRQLLDKEAFKAITAKVDQKIVGGLTLYTLHQYYSKKPLAYIYDLAVMVQYQRKGIGKKLIDFTNEYCKQMGFEEVFVQADRADGYAVDFYRSTQPTAEEDVIHFYYSL